jgi:hypothetical protein
VDADLDTLATALYVTIDELLTSAPHLAPWRPAVGIAPKLSDAELLTLAVMQALLGFTSEARWLRYAGRHLRHLFPYLPGQPGYNKRLRRTAGLLGHLIRAVAPRHGAVERRCLGGGLHPGGVRPLPGDHQAVGAGRVAHYGYCASHSRYFWGLRLHLVCTPAGLPVTWALADPKLDKRQVLRCVLDEDADLLAERPGLLLLADKGYISAELDDYLHARGAELLRPSYRNRAPRPGQRLLAPIRQLIESVYDTLKGQLDLELHSGRSLAGVTARVAQRLLALTAAIWHNRATGQPVTRSLIAYDH